MIVKVGMNVTVKANIGVFSGKEIMITNAHGKSI